MSIRIRKSVIRLAAKLKSCPLVWNDSSEIVTIKGSDGLQRNVWAETLTEDIRSVEELEVATPKLPSVLWGSKSIRIRKSVIRLAAKLKCCPLVWDDSCETVVPIKDSDWFQRSGWYLNVCVAIAYETFLLVRTVQIELGYVQVIPAEAAAVKFWAGIYMFQVVCQVTLVLHWHEIPGLLWRASNWFQRVEGYYREHPNADAQAMLTSALDKNTGLMVCTDVAFPVVWVVLYVLYPGGLVYPTSLMDDPEDMIPFLLFRSTGIAIYAYIILTWYCSMYVWFTSFLPVAINLPLVLKALAVQLKHMDSREGGDILRFYREAQILASEFSQVCLVFIPGMQWSITVGITYCLCGAFLLPDWLPRAILFAVFVIVVATMGKIFTYLGKFWTESNGFLELAKRALKDRESRKVLRSMVPIKVVMGGMYFIDELSALVMLDFIITSSISVIVASKTAHR